MYCFYKNKTSMTPTVKKYLGQKENPVAKNTPVGVEGSFAHDGLIN